MNDRKRQVLLTAQRLFVEQGFATTSVQDILEGSGISKGTFYNYFSSKNECLMAILEHAQDVAAVRQRELLIGKDAADKHVLAEQIAIRLQVNQEQNLIMLFEAIFHSKEQELRDFVKKHYLDELIWLTDRITDVYGKQVVPYAFDCAVILIGMLQHMMHIWILHSKETVVHARPVQYVIQRMDAIVGDLIHSKDILLGGEILYHLKSDLQQKEITKQELVAQLSGFEQRLGVNSPDGKEYIHFLLDELRGEKPRVYLAETVIRAFTQAFTGTADEPEALEIASKAWKYIDTL
jgi:AcrR family transcriptional regulator